MPTAQYKLRDGTRVVGVTTPISRFKDSGALMRWAFKQGQSGATRLYDASEKAADIGTAAHGMVEAHINGGDPVEALVSYNLPGKDGEKAMNAFDQYLKWEHNSGLKILTKYQEISLVSEEYRFGGTPDAIGMDGNSLVCLDWKTSSGIFVDFAIQVSAYGYLISHGERLDNREKLGLGEVQGFHICRFAKDYPDFEHRYFGELNVAWEQFKLFLKAYEIDKELKRRVK